MAAFEVHALLMNCVIRCTAETVEIRFRVNVGRRDIYIYIYIQGVPC